MKGFLEAFQSKLMLTEEDKRTGVWEVDDVHFAYPITPLFASFMVPATSEGSKRAFANLNAPIVQFRTKLADGRLYTEVVVYPGDPKQRYQKYMETLEPLLSSMKQRLQSYVDEELLPFYRKLDAYRQQPSTLLEAKSFILELFEFYQSIWHRHFELVFTFDGFEEMENMYTKLVGEENPAAFYQLFSGVMNKTLETNRELWKLAEYAKRSTTLCNCLALSNGDDYVLRLSESEEGREFLLLLQNVLEVYGYRSSNSHEFVDETWIENPEYALRIIATYMTKEYDFDHEFTQMVKEREEQLANRLATMPEGELKQRFVQYYQWALDSWSVKEDHHFYIDAMLPAKTRLFLLHVSEMLVEQRVYADRNDIFYLYVDELLDVLVAPVSQALLVEKRKNEHEENKKKEVPLSYGNPPQQSAVPNVDLNSENTIKGIAASQGQYKGTVKVVRDTDDFSKIQRGDILVCKTTTPPWTVLFSVVGAVVTDVGGILQHTATVAREYKIPCVVGTKLATSVLKDGDIVIVNGTQGVVLIE